jgi:hypothetical protein
VVRFSSRSRWLVSLLLCTRNVIGLMLSSPSASSIRLQKACYGTASEALEEVTTSPEIRWNFEKFLLNKKGKPVERLFSHESPLLFENKIRSMLGLGSDEHGQPNAASAAETAENTSAEKIQPEL